MRTLRLALPDLTPREAEAVFNCIARLLDALWEAYRRELLWAATRGHPAAPPR